MNAEMSAALNADLNAPCGAMRASRQDRPAVRSALRPAGSNAHAVVQPALPTHQ